MKFSEMETSTTPSNDDLLPILEGGTENRKVSFITIANWILNKFILQELQTESKIITNAVNENKESIENLKTKAPKILTGTLYTGLTSISFTDASISDTSFIDVYTSIYDASPKNITQDNTTVTITFPKTYSTNVTVKLLVTNR